jgi:UDP-N-acetylmuramoyl-L-alanyl-D-glutamate--2,6-diaminopimelate ligase
MARRSVPVGALAAVIPGARVLGDATAPVTGIEYDSRAVHPGDLFAALRGADFDGHHFVAEAEAHGAGAVLVEELASSALPQVKVHDSRAALAAVSAAFFGSPSRDIDVIGITGTDGKTTTTYLADHILRSADRTTGLVGTVAIRLAGVEVLHSTRQTTPESSDIQRYLRQMVDASTQWAILEATSHGLAMHRLDHVHFRIGAVTNITHEHLDFHGTVDAYRLAKALLLERVAANHGVAIVNVDDAGARSILSHADGADLVRFSARGADAELRAHAIQSTETGSEFDVEGDTWGSARVSLPLIGEFNVANALCALAISLAAGVELERAAAALKDAPSVPGRMERIDVGQPFSVVVDYAHTPESLRKVLHILARLHPRGRLIAVFGSAGERDREKRSIQGAVAARLAEVIVVTSEDPRNEDADEIISEIASGAEAEGAEPGQRLFCRTDRRDAIRLALELAGPGDCVLLAGKGHEGSIIWGRVKVPWNEAGVAAEILAELGYGARAV